MRKIWVHKAKSFKEAEEFNRNYYLSMSASERIETMQFLREIYSGFKKHFKNESRKRLQRIIKVIQ